jgi:hypothetical protein
VLVRGWLMASEGEPAMAVALLTPLVKAALDELDPRPWKPGWMRMLVRTGLAAGDADFAAGAVELAEEGARRNPGWPRSRASPSACEGCSKVTPAGWRARPRR